MAVISKLLPPKPPPVALSSAANRHSSKPAPSQRNLISSFETSAEFQLLCSRYPQLRAQLRKVYEATCEPPIDQLDKPPFGRYGHGRGRSRGRGGSRVRGPEGSAMWSQLKGFKSGLHRLKMLRRVEGAEGESLREFSKLVIKCNESAAMTPTPAMVHNG